MILSFMRELNGRPTYFPEKILASLEGGAAIENAGRSANSALFQKYDRKKVKEYLYYGITKDHTVRLGQRWDNSKTIHFVTGMRTKHQFQFAHSPRCIVQKISFEWSCQELDRGSRLAIHERAIYIDGTSLPTHLIPIFSIRDGFNSPAEMWAYFESRALPLMPSQRELRLNEPIGVFSTVEVELPAQLIHWTTKTY